MKVLVLGQGAREHAIVKALIRTGTSKKDILVAPGNKGIAKQVKTEPDLDPNDPLAVTRVSSSPRIPRRLWSTPKNT
jgi:phosphoribosylamine--glycine ligase